MLTLTKIETSLDGDGWSVRIGESHWRFNRIEFAEQFCSRMLDDDFASSIMVHAREHDWRVCQPEICKGALWQIIQGIE